MTQIIPLTKIGFFNPGRLSDREMEQSFIARIPFFEFIFKKIISEKPSSIPQHHLIIGQRGMGKSSLLARIAAELRKSPYSVSFIPLSFPEEQYNIDRLSKFWLNCLDALADALDKEHNEAELNALDKEIAKLTKEKALDANEVFKIFETWIDKIKRRPVLLVDNLNLIFSKIDKEGQHQLRAILMSKGAPILVGASATTIDETINYQAPFYDAFQINYLKKLSFKESVDVLINLARITGNPSIQNSIYLQKGRIEALYHLTGGTPRTLAILFPLIQNGFSENIQTDLDALLDLITPLYKARFEELSSQLQVVLDAIALHWDPVTIEQLREITLLENAQLSPQLKRLVDVGWIQKLDAYKSKGGAYELSERFFNIWYLMRRSSRRQKRELYCLTKFLESFYGSELKRIAIARIDCKTENVDHITLDLALADALKERKLSETLRKKSYEAIIDLSISNDEVLKIFSIPASIKAKKLKDLFENAERLMQIKDYEEAESVLKAIIRLNQSFEPAWITLAGLYMWHLAKYDEAEHAFMRIAELNNTSGFAWGSLGTLYMEHTHNFDMAEQAYKKSIEIDGNKPYTWTNLGKLYMRYLDRYDEAERAFKKAIEIDENYKYAWRYLGEIYADYLKKYQEAEQAFKKTIELDELFVSGWAGLADLYIQLDRYDEAERAFRKAIEIDENYFPAWTGIGTIYMYVFDKFNEAEQAFKKAIEINNKNSYPWESLGTLYMQYLDRYDEAERAFRKAIEIDENYFPAWESLGTLYMQYSNRYSEAEQAFKRAVQIDDSEASIWNDIGNLYQDFLHNYEEAEKAYSKAIEIDGKKASPKFNLVFLKRDKLGKIEEAKLLFETLEKNEGIKDSYLLNKALFAYYEKNIGIAEGFIKEALLEIGDLIPLTTTDDWYRAAAVIIKLGYINSLLHVFSDTGHDVILRPFYIAVEAIAKEEDETYLNSVAAELREPAKKIIESIKNHL